MAMQLSGSINLNGSLTGSILADNGLVSSSQQVTNYYKFAETASANTFYGNQKIKGNLDIDNKVSITGSLIVSSSTNQLWAIPDFELYNGLGNVNFRLTPNTGNQFQIQAYGTKAEITQPNEPLRLLSPTLQFVKYDDTPTKVEVTGSLRVNGPLRGNIISGGLDINGGVTGSFKGNLAGVADYASTIAVANTGTTTDTNLFPIFSLNPVLASYTSLYSHASSSFFYNGVTRRLHMEGFVVSGSNNIVEISGSLNVTGSTVQIGNNTLTGNTILSGSINVSGSTTFEGTHLLTGTNTIIGNTYLSGSINVSGSSNFHNSVFIVTGSSFFTGSHTVVGNTTMSGSINVASGSGFYRAGNKLFNYGQWCSLETQSGSADTAYAVKMDTKNDGSEGVYVANNGSGFPTRLTVENTGLYNIQFSFQLNTTATETCDFSVWYAITGSNVANSNTDFSIDKTAGGGNGVAALNFLTPITANDYVELYWSKTTANGELQYKAPQGTPTRPATPSVIVTITQVA